MIELRFVERMRTDEEEGVPKRERILQWRESAADMERDAEGAGPWRDVPLVKET